MFKRYILYVAFGVALSALFALHCNSNAYAAGERYSWQSYSKIGASGGEYTKLNTPTEGGVAALEFVQDKDDPNKFVASPKANDCDGTLTLNLAPDGGTGTIVIDKCPLLGGVGLVATISNREIIEVAIRKDLVTMHDDFVNKNCKAPETSSPQADERLQRCRTAAETTYNNTVESCKNQHNYETGMQLSNKFLTCVAEGLCVDRPAETVEEKEPNSVKPKCTIADIGWIVCQIMQIESWLADKSFDLLASWLEIDPLTKEVVRTPSSTNTQQQNTNNPTNSTSTNNPGSTNTPQNPQEPSTPVNTQLPVTENNETTVYTAWKFFLGMTNVFFVAIFLAIIISYITGWGLSNYNIKKIIPRFIAASILTVLSFWICALAIDLSNVIGKTAKDALVDITPINTYGSWTDITQQVTSIGPSDESDSSKSKQKDADQGQSGSQSSSTTQSGSSQPSTNNTPQTSGSSTTAQCTANIPPQSDNTQEPEQGEDDPKLLKAAGAVSINVLGAAVAGTAALFVLLAILVPFMAAALITLIVTLLLLMLRHVIIIVLVVISPIAFVMLLFPNTKQWFDKWRTIFTTLLLLYPAVAMIYGASHFVAYTIYDQDRVRTFDSLILKIFALTVLVVPLFMTPALMKLGGGIMAKFTGMLNGSGAVGKLRESAAGYQKSRADRLTGAALSGKTLAFNPAAQLRKVRSLRSQSKSATSRALSGAEKEYYARNNKGGRSAADSLTNKEFAHEALEETNAAATAALSPVHLNQMAAVKARWDNEGKTGEDFVNMARTGKYANGQKLSDIERAAAAQAAVNHANEEELHDIIANSGQMGDLARRTLVDQIRKTGRNKENAHLGAGALNQIAEGKVNSSADVDKMIAKAASNNAYGGQTMVNQTSYTLERLQNLKDNNKIDAQGLANLKRSSEMIQGNQKLSTKVDSNKMGQIVRLGR